jgi:tetratricopeptide (TPR) repeat protein
MARKSPRTAQSGRKLPEGSNTPSTAPQQSPGIMSQVLPDTDLPGGSTGLTRWIAPREISIKWLAFTTLGLMLATVIAYLPALRSEFLPFDDQEYVYLNPIVYEGITPQSIYWAFTQVHVSNWHPLTWLSHMLDCQMYGLDPSGHNATSILVHAANTGLTFLLLYYLTRQWFPSFIVAALFALHPTHIEAVAWVAQRKTLLSTFFVLLSIFGYVSFIRHHHWKYYAASLLAFGLSLLSKQTFVTLPLLLLLIDYWPLRRGVKPDGANSYYSSIKLLGILRWIPDKVPYALLAVMASLTAIFAQTTAMQSLQSFPLPVRLGNVCIAYLKYMLGLIWPTNLSIYYTIDAELITAPLVVASGVVVSAATLCVVLGRNKFPYLVTGWFWFLIAMLPVIGIVHVGSQSMADRYLYNASFGLFVAVVWLATDLTMSSQKPAVVLGRLSLAVLVCSTAISLFMTHQRNRRWMTVEGVFAEALEHEPTNWLANLLLAERAVDKQDYLKGVEYASAAIARTEHHRFFFIHAMASRGLKDFQTAIEQLERAIEIEPNDALAYSLLGIVYSELGNFQLADGMRREAEEKLELPRNREYGRIIALVLRNCGIILKHEERYQEALDSFYRALEYDPRNVALIIDAAQTEMLLGRADDATQRLEAAMWAMPSENSFSVALASLYSRSGRFKEAEKLLLAHRGAENLATEINMELAAVMMRTGRVMEAERILQECLAKERERPSSLEVERRLSDLHVQLADILLARKAIDQAMMHYDAAISSNPDHFVANNNLAWLLATRVRVTESEADRAVRLAEHAVHLPGSQSKGALGTLAAAYAAVGRWDEAVATATKALENAERLGGAVDTEHLRAQLEMHQKRLPFVDTYPSEE